MKHRMKNSLSGKLLLAVILLGGGTAPALGLSSDARQPIHIESDQQSLDIPGNIVTFTGNVVLMQGSIKIHADKVVVTRAGGEKGRETIDGYGNPATFYQKQDNGKPIKGRAQHMHYEVKRELVILTGNAWLQQLDSSISASKITYLVGEQKMQALGSPGRQVGTVLLPSQLQDSPPASNQGQ